MRIQAWVLIRFIDCKLSAVALALRRKLDTMMIRAVCKIDKTVKLQMGEYLYIETDFMVAALSARISVIR